MYFYNFSNKTGHLKLSLNVHFFYQENYGHHTLEDQIYNKIGNIDFNRQVFHC